MSTGVDPAREGIYHIALRRKWLWCQRRYTPPPFPQGIAGLRITLYVVVSGGKAQYLVFFLNFVLDIFRYGDRVYSWLSGHTGIYLSNVVSDPFAAAIIPKDSVRKGFKEHGDFRTRNL